jgi:AraC-like DNA-binding protein
MIGETRQFQTAEIEETFDEQVGRARGVIRKPVPAGRFTHSRRAPAGELIPFIAHYWMISWDLTGCEPHIAESLPHPNVHMVFGEGDVTIHGVQTHKFVRTLEGRSGVFGVKFKPGGFRPFFGSAVSQLADRSIAAESVFGPELHRLAKALLSELPEQEKIDAANAFLLARRPGVNDSVLLADELVMRILTDPEIKTVDDLARESATGKRTLQRIFSEYVGVSPKWVIRRYRMHELIEKLNWNEEVDWAELALDLGYFDQAHLINDFTAIMGCSPARYRKDVLKKS